MRTQAVGIAQNGLAKWQAIASCLEARRALGFQTAPITCIVSQVAASAGFCAPSISTLTS